MGKEKISQKEINKIIHLRQLGHSLPEIKNVVNRGSATIFRYAKNVEILPQYLNLWKINQGGSKKRSLIAWKNAQKRAEQIINDLGITEKIIIAACLYWGEGTKRDFNLLNSDPNLIKTFVTCLKEIGVTKEELRVTVRIYEDLDRGQAIRYWAQIIGIPSNRILNVNILKGKKRGKLQYGMCRVRVTKGGNYLKLLQSVAKVITEKLDNLPL
ncbi:hypothetical protein HY061_01840 [Candidatus Azambacteria bacterium]|nr:hypothetical protein [Candidatus Azambacteria bacterium]